jgi:hypothetical protein
VRASDLPDDEDDRLVHGDPDADDGLAPGWLCAGCGQVFLGARCPRCAAEPGPGDARRLRVKSNPDRPSWAERAFLEPHPNCRCTTEPIGIMGYCALPLEIQILRDFRGAQAIHEAAVDVAYAELEYQALSR